MKSKWRTKTKLEVITTEFQFCAKNDKRTQIWHEWKFWWIISRSFKYWLATDYIGFQNKYWQIGKYEEICLLLILANIFPMTFLNKETFFKLFKLDLNIFNIRLICISATLKWDPKIKFKCSMLYMYTYLKIKIKFNYVYRHLDIISDFVLA